MAQSARAGAETPNHDATSRSRHGFAIRFGAETLMIMQTLTSDLCVGSARGSGAFPRVKESCRTLRSTAVPRADGRACAADGTYSCGAGGAGPGVVM